MRPPSFALTSRCANRSGRRQGEDRRSTGKTAERRILAVAPNLFVRTDHKRRPATEASVSGIASHGGLVLSPEDSSDDAGGSAGTAAPPVQPVLCARLIRGRHR